MARERASAFLPLTRFANHLLRGTKDIKDFFSSWKVSSERMLRTSPFVVAVFALGGSVPASLISTLGIAESCVLLETVIVAIRLVKCVEVLVSVIPFAVCLFFVAFHTVRISAISRVIT